MTEIGAPAVAAAERWMEKALPAWADQLPAVVHPRLLALDEMARILTLAAEVASSDDAEADASLQAQSYRLANQLLPDLGPELTLRFIRDYMVRALEQSPPPGASAADLARVASRVSDGVWRCNSDLQSQTIQRLQSHEIRQELSLAKRIQERLLPHSVPDVPGFDIAGKVLAAAEVGGDYWSCRYYPEDDIATLKLADVSGHGIAAATLVSAVKFVSGGYYRGAKTAAQVMQRTNNIMVRDTPSDILVTMVYAWLFPQNREMMVVNAGHSPLLHYHGDNCRMIGPTGPALGVTNVTYRDVRLSLAPGDLFVTCSDGVTAPGGPIALGEDWVRERIQEVRFAPAQEIVDHLINGALHEYGYPRDDMSVLAVRSVA